jgi:hypothetical protein
MGIFISILLFLAGCNSNVKKTPPLKINQRLVSKAIEAKKYCIENNFDTTYCILVDMQIPSGKFRFFVWSFKTSEPLDQGLCSHGSCGNIDLPEDEELPYFTNQPNSLCSSLGKYKIGKRGWSNYGIHVNYKLHGLEKTNSNAFNRVIVLHSFNELEDKEIYPAEAMESWGCPAVSNQLLTRVDERLSKKEQPVLMWIFN